MSPASLQLGLQGNRTAFQPGEEIAGAARWEFDAPPKSAVVRLIWSTRGSSAEDAAIVETITFDAPEAGDLRGFSFRAPEAPYSFSGKLITLVWSIELVLQPDTRFQRIEIVIAPESRQIVLPVIEPRT